MSVRYTDAELLASAIADQETDLTCALRDGLPEYAEECRARIARLLKTTDARDIDSILR